MSIEHPTAHENSPIPSAHRVIVAGGGVAGLVSERLAARQLRRHMKEMLGNLKRIVEGVPAAVQ